MASTQARIVIFWAFEADDLFQETAKQNVQLARVIKVSSEAQQIRCVSGELERTPRGCGCAFRERKRDLQRKRASRVTRASLIGYLPCVLVWVKIIMLTLL